jgi:hypothetical protein
LASNQLDQIDGLLAIVSAIIAQRRNLADRF